LSTYVPNVPIQEGIETYEKLSRRIFNNFADLYKHPNMWIEDVNDYKADELFSEYMLEAVNVYLKRK
jgi:hypothetical protein